MRVHVTSRLQAGKFLVESGQNHTADPLPAAASNVSAERFWFFPQPPGRRGQGIRTNFSFVSPFPSRLCIVLLIKAAIGAIGERQTALAGAECEKPFQ